jgi:DNA-binding beta-propeller fold protein YncE
MKKNIYVKISLILWFFCFIVGNISVSSQTKIFWSSQSVDKIMCINSDKTEKSDIITSDLSQPCGLAIDSINKKIYWSDFGTGKIERANLDGSSRESIITGLTSILGIALDISNDKIYWAGGSDSTIKRSNLDGSNIETLVSGLNDPTGIALDISNNKMYWTEFTKIQKSNLDGTNVSDLGVAALQPIGITIDLIDQKLYWAESYLMAAQIRRADVDGSDEEIVLYTAGFLDGETGYDLKLPAWLALDTESNIIYWTDTYAVISVNVNGENKETIYHDGQDWPNGGVAVYHDRFPSSIGIPSENNSSLFEIYPNPAKSHFFVHLSLEQSTEVKITAINSQGQIVKDIYNGFLSANNHEFPIDIEDLPNGLYYILLKTNTTNSVQKISIAK